MSGSVRVDHEMQVIVNLRNRLVEAYRGRRSPQLVTETVSEAFHDFDEAPIRDFVPLLVEHVARDRLGRG